MACVALELAVKPDAVDAHVSERYGGEREGGEQRGEAHCSVGEPREEGFLLKGPYAGRLLMRPSVL